MSNDSVSEEILVEKGVTHHIEVDGQLILVKNVPARVNVEMGERMFAPKTMKHLQKIVRRRRLPACTIETPVYKYA